MSKKDEYGYMKRETPAAVPAETPAPAAPAAETKKTRASGWDNEGLTSAQVREMQGWYGAEADGLWGKKSTAAAGGLGAQAAWTKYSAARAAEPSTSPAAGASESFSYAAAPDYTERYRQQSAALAQDVLARAPFAYGAESDPVYAAYRKQYAREGRRAAEDVLGRYAAMTGGMPSSAAVTAAQQAGDYYAAQAADKVPELYELAYSMYADEDARRRKDVELLRALESDEYARYKGALGQYDADRAFAYEQYRDALADALAAEKLALEREKLAAKGK